MCTHAYVYIYVCVFNLVLSLQNLRRDKHFLVRRKLSGALEINYFSLTEAFLIFSVTISNNATRDVIGG